MSKKYRVELTTLAQEQIYEITEYIIDNYQAPETADRFLDGLKSELSKLDTMPERAKLIEKEPWHSKGVHKYVIGNYIAYFLIDDSMNIVYVTAVVLDKRNQKKQLTEMNV